MYQEALRNTRAMEHQDLTQMENRVGGLDGCPDYAAVLNKHDDRTEKETRRLDEEIEEADADGTGLREAVFAAAGAVGAASHGIMPDTTLKKLYPSQASIGMRARSAPNGELTFHASRSLRSEATMGACDG